MGVESWSGRFELVPVEKIVIDRRYQRDPKAVIEAIKADFAWESFGVVQCADRGDGFFYAYDGQQRYLAARALGATNVPCVIFPMEKVAHEAIAFVSIQVNRVNATAHDKWVSLLFAGDPTVTLVNGVVEQMGYTIGKGGTGQASARTITSISTVQRIFNRSGEEGLRRTLAVVRSLWQDDRAAVDGRVLDSIDLFLASDKCPSRMALEHALAHETPSSLLRKADGLRYDYGGSKMQNLQRVLVQAMDKWQKSKAGKRQTQEDEQAAA